MSAAKIFFDQLVADVAAGFPASGVLPIPVLQNSTGPNDPGNVAGLYQQLSNDLLFAQQKLAAIEAYVGTITPQHVLEEIYMRMGRPDYGIPEMVDMLGFLAIAFMLQSELSTLQSNLSVSIVTAPQTRLNNFVTAYSSQLAAAGIQT